MSQHPAPEGAGADKAPAIPLAALNAWLCDREWFRTSALREWLESQPSLGRGGNAMGSAMRDANGHTPEQQAQRGTSALRAVVAFTDDKVLSGNEEALILACNVQGGPGVPACTPLGARMLSAALAADDIVANGMLALRWDATGCAVEHLPPYEDAGEYLTGADLFDVIRGLVWIPDKDSCPCPVHATWLCPYS